jgi:hypothetical protein
MAVPLKGPTTRQTRLAVQSIFHREALGVKRRGTRRCSGGIREDRPTAFENGGGLTGVGLKLRFPYEFTQRDHEIEAAP